jgi:predicted nucleic acid-binding protein
VAVAYDTNVLVYAERVARHRDDDEKIRLLEVLLPDIPPGAVRIPVQAAGELYNVLTRRGGWSRASAHRAVETWVNLYEPIPTSVPAMVSAFELAARHRFFIWDAVVVAAAAEAGCDMLLSEDMHHGFAWRGVTVVNPFAATRHPLLTRLLRRSIGD